MQLQLFGYDVKFGRLSKEEPIPTIDYNRDGSIVLPEAAASGGFLTRSVLDRDRYDSLIDAYRRIAYIPEVSSAIDEIINECVVIEADIPAVTLNIDPLIQDGLLTKKVAAAIRTSFEEVLDLLDFNHEGYDIVRNWYVDSSVNYLMIVDPDRPKEGIKQLMKLDPKRVRHIKLVKEDLSTGKVEMKEDFYVYLRGMDMKLDQKFGMSIRTSSETYAQAIQQNVLFKIRPEAMAACSSGLVDQNTNTPYGYLHKAVRVANQLDLVENAIIVYRLSRSHSVRAVYVDTGNLPPAKAQAKVEQVKIKFKRDVKYDTVRGELTSTNRTMDLSEDIYIGRSGGNKTAEIDDISPSPNLGSIEDIEFFRQKLYSALDVPASRFKESSPIFGNNSEISRDELKFQRFITRIRSRFARIFVELLRTQVVLKGILSEDEFFEIERRLKFEFNKDSFFTEVKELEILGLRIDAVEKVSSLIGKYVSHDTVRRRIFGQTEEEVQDEDEKIAKEAKDPRFKPSEEGM